jgi:hypothetical protein
VKFIGDNERSQETWRNKQWLTVMGGSRLLEAQGKPSISDVKSPDTRALEALTTGFCIPSPKGQRKRKEKSRINEPGEKEYFFQKSWAIWSNDKQVSALEVS